MTLEIRSGKTSQIYNDDVLISMGELRHALGFSDQGAIFTAGKRMGLRRVYTRTHVRGSRQNYRVADFPKLIEGLSFGRSAIKDVFPKDTRADFEFVSPSGMTVIYRYPKK